MNIQQDIQYLHNKKDKSVASIGGLQNLSYEGDIVDVYAVDPATEMLTLMAENVYVSEVYDNAGKKITEDDGVATSFTVWVTPEEVESINTAVVYGGIQMYLKTE